MKVFHHLGLYVQTSEQDQAKNSPFERAQVAIYEGSSSGKNMTQCVHSTIVQDDQITALHVIF